MTHEEKVVYHEIMKQAWIIFGKQRDCEEFGDKWWQEIIGEYDELRKPYKGTLLDDYVCQLAQAFLDEHERVYKRGKQKGISEAILSGSQGYHQEELQLSDTVSEVGGSEEDNVQIEAADWG